MPLHTSTTVRTRATIAAASILAAGNCHAMGGEGIAESFLIFFGSYFLGVLLLSINWWVTKSTVCGWLLFAFVLSPFAIFVAAGPIGEYRAARLVEEVAQDRARNLQMFSAFCKDRKRVVDWQVAQASSASLLVRIDEQLSRHGNDLSASRIHDYMTAHPGVCRKTSLGKLEGFVLGHYSEGKGHAREVHTFQTCVRDEACISAQTGSRFELVLGEQVETSQTPVGRRIDTDTMSKVSARLMDSRTGTTLARDTIHILLVGEGATVCPDGVAQIATLIADVFPK